MNVDTGEFRAITGERDHLRSEVVTAGEIRGAIATLADAVATLGDQLAVRLAPVSPVVATAGRPRHARPRGGHLRLVQDGRR